MPDTDWTGSATWGEKGLPVSIIVTLLCSLLNGGVENLLKSRSTLPLFGFLITVSIFVCISVQMIVWFVRVSDARIYIRSLTGIIDRPLTDVCATKRTYKRLTIYFCDGKQKAVSTLVGDLDSLERYIAARTKLNSKRSQTSTHSNRNSHTQSASLKTVRRNKNLANFVDKLYSFGFRHQRLFRFCVYFAFVFLFLCWFAFFLALTYFTFQLVPASWAPKDKAARQIFYAIIELPGWSFITLCFGFVASKVARFWLAFSIKEAGHSVKNSDE